MKTAKEIKEIAKKSPLMQKSIADLKELARVKYGVKDDEVADKRLKIQWVQAILTKMDEAVSVDIVDSSVKIPTDKVENQLAPIEKHDGLFVWLDAIIRRLVATTIDLGLLMGLKMRSHLLPALKASYESLKQLYVK